MEQHQERDNLEHQQWEYSIVGDPFHGGRPRDQWTQLLSECFCKDDNETDSK